MSCMLRPALLEPQGAVPQALTLSGGARFIAWRSFLRKCQQGLKHFWECQVCLSYGPVLRPTLKKVLCHTCPVGGMYNKYYREIKILISNIVSSMYSLLLLWDYNITIYIQFSLVQIFYLMAYQPSWVIYYQSHLHRKTSVILFKAQLEWR